MITVNHYGLHRQDEFVFLHEQDGGRCISPGFTRLESPFATSGRWWLPCPHQLGAPEYGPILDHPMIEAMGPAQAGSLFYVRPEHAPWLWRLAAMTPGSERNVEPYWTIRRPRVRRLEPKLRLTNAAPLVLVDVEPADHVDMEQLAQLPRLRNLIICGPLKLASATLLDPAGLDWHHDWAAEGRHRLHKIIQGY